METDSSTGSTASHMDQDSGLNPWSVWSSRLHLHFAFQRLILKSIINYYKRLESKLKMFQIQVSYRPGNNWLPYRENRSQTWRTALGPGEPFSDLENRSRPGEPFSDLENRSQTWRTALRLMYSMCSCFSL